MEIIMISRNISSTSYKYMVIRASTFNMQIQNGLI